MSKRIGRPAIGPAFKMRLTPEQRAFLEESFHGEPLAVAIRQIINDKIDQAKK